MKETILIPTALKTGCLLGDSEGNDTFLPHQELSENILSYFPLHCGSDTEIEVILPTPKKILPWAEEEEIWGLGSLQRHSHIDTKCNLRPEHRSLVPNPENMEKSWR